MTLGCSVVVGKEWMFDYGRKRYDRRETLNEWKSRNENLRTGVFDTIKQEITARKAEGSREST